MSHLARRRRHSNPNPLFPVGTVFVAANGNNSNNGLSQLLPKLTLSNADAAAAVGASVLGRGGDTFRETVTCAVNSRTFGSYGSGMMRSSGADIATGWAPAGLGTNTYSIAFASPVRLLLVNGVLAVLGTSSSALANGQFFYGSSTLYYRSDAGNPDTLGLVTEAGQRDYCINQNSKDSISVVGIIAEASQHTSNSAIYFQGIGHVTGWTVSQCIVRNCYSSALLCHAASNGCTVTFNQFLNCGQHGFWFDTADAQENVSILHNTLDGCGWRTTGVNFPSGIIGGMHSGEVAFNSVNAQGAGGSGAHAHAIYAGQDLPGGSTLLIHDNSCIGTLDGTGIKTTNDAFIYNNVLGTNHGGGINPGQNSGTGNCTVIAYRNVLYTNATSSGAGIDVKNAGSTGTLTFKGYHNTLFSNSVGGSGGEVLIESNLAVCDFRNNIVYATSTASSKYFTFSVAQTGTVTIDKNVYFHGDASTPFKYNGTQMSLTTWRAQAFTPDVHSVVGDPLFVSAGTNNYRLSSGSPAINLGDVIAGINDGVSQPDAGAFEFGA